MAKITVLEAKTYQGKPSGFKVTLSDGTTGNLQEKESDKGLRVGDEVIVRLIPYTSKAGVTSNLLGLRLNQGGTPQAYTPPPTPLPQPTQQPNNPPPRTNVPTGSSGTIKAQASIKAMEYIIDCFIADKITWDLIMPRHKELTGYLNDAVDECLQG